MTKPTRKYSQILTPVIQVGLPVVLVTPETPQDKVTITTEVLAYDEVTETFETLNTVYEPA